MFLIIRMRSTDKLSPQHLYHIFRHGIPIVQGHNGILEIMGTIRIDVRISLIRNAIFVKIQVLLKVFSVANSEVISLHKAKISGLPLFKEIGYLADYSYLFFRF